MTTTDRAELLTRAHAILTAIVAGRIAASSDMWNVAIDRCRACGIPTDVTRDVAGAELLLARIG